MWPLGALATGIENPVGFAEKQSFQVQLYRTALASVALPVLHRWFPAHYKQYEVGRLLPQLLYLPCPMSR